MQLAQHHIEEIKEGTYRFRCTVCGQKWTREPRSTCAGVPTYQSGEVPEGFYSMTRMRLEFRRQTNWDQPHAAVRKLKAPYLLMLYDINRCEPIPVFATQERASEKRRKTLHDRWTCWVCGKYHRHRWQQQHFHRDLQMCHGCHWKIDRWNAQITWAQERIQENAQIATFTREWGSGFNNWGTLTNIEILHLDGSLVPQPEHFDPDMFFPAILAVSTIYPPDTYNHLYAFCDQQRYHIWETRHEFEGGVPLVRKDGTWINVSWHMGEDIYRRVAITDPYLHLCQLWEIEIDEHASQAEKMRQVILTVARQEPLELSAPPSAQQQAS